MGRTGAANWAFKSAPALRLSGADRSVVLLLADSSERTADLVIGRGLASTRRCATRWACCHYRKKLGYGEFGG